MSATDVPVDANAGPAGGTTLLSVGWGSLAYQVGIFSFLILLLIGAWFLRGVPEPPLDASGAPGDRAGPPPDHLVPVFKPMEPR